MAVRGRVLAGQLELVRLAVVVAAPVGSVAVAVAAGVGEPELLAAAVGGDDVAGSPYIAWLYRVCIQHSRHAWCSLIARLRWQEMHSPTVGFRKRQLRQAWQVQLWSLVTPQARQSRQESGNCGANG